MSLKSMLFGASSKESDDGYPVMERIIRERVANTKRPLFTTDATDLFGFYLNGLSNHGGYRQHYNCHACRRFIDRYGGLVTINSETGITEPLLWGSWNETEVPRFFADSVFALSGMVSRAKVTGVFLASEKVWGTPQTGDWSHLSADNPAPFSSSILNDSQAMAAKKQDYAILCRSLAEFKADDVATAVRVLKADALDRSEKTLAIAEWFLTLHQAIAGVRGSRRENLIWFVTATAPPGWCHVRTTMIGTLLEDIQSGMEFDTIVGRWSQKMHPLQYQRPTAPPKSGNIEQAEKIVAALGSAGALARRFAGREDILAALWTPKPVPEEAQSTGQGGGVFSHLRAEERRSELELPAVVMTWDKFARTVLPDVLSLECLIPHGRTSFFAMVTASDPAAPPILQWDGLEGYARNPASWYFYHGGSEAAHWGLTPGIWVRVNVVCSSPSHWQAPEKFRHHNEMVLLVLEGCKDVRHTHGGGFFPESLRSEYHGVRGVMEAYANRAEIAGKEEGTANGIALQKDNGGDWRITIRVRTANGAALYKLDRWD